MKKENVILAITAITAIAIIGTVKYIRNQNPENKLECEEFEID